MKQLNILLVEDDNLDAKTVRRAFEKSGFSNRLTRTCDGQDALDLIRGEGTYADAYDPDLVLLDLNMPRKNGVEFLRDIRADKNLRHLPVVVLTTSGEKRDRMESYNLGVAGYILKPLDFSQFVQVCSAVQAYWALCEMPAS